MSGSADDDGPFQGVVAGEKEFQQAIALLRTEVESLQRLEPLFVEGTAVLRGEIQSLRTQLSHLPAAGGQGVLAAEMPGLRTELRNTLREATEHLRTLVVEEVNELRGELQAVRARLNDRRSQDRADLQTTLAAGSDTLRAALAEDAAGLRAELEAVRAQLKEQQVADQQLLRAELRAALREWNEHLRTRIVEEATELRSELHQVRGHLTDQQTQHRSDLKAALGEGSGQVLAALAEATSALRTEVAFLRDQVPNREMVGGALAQQELLRTALLAEIELLHAEVRAVPDQVEEQRIVALEGMRTAVHEGSLATEASFALHAERLLAEVQSLLAQHEARHGDEGQQLRAIVTAGTENLRAALLAETASARASLVDHSERLRTEMQAVWAQLNDQHAEERAELTRALAEGTDFVRGALRREVEAIGTGLAAAQAAAQDELASLRGRVEAFSALYTNAQANLNASLAAAQENAAATRVQLDALGMDLAAAQANAREDAELVAVRLAEQAATDREAIRAAVLATSEQLRASLLVELTELIQAQVEQLRSVIDDTDREEERGRVLAEQAATDREAIRAAVLETGEQLRASLLVELTELIQAQVEQLRSVIDDTDREEERGRVLAEVTAAGERLAAFQEELAAWRQEAADERTNEVDALLAAVAGNEERLHQLVSTELSEARAGTGAAFAAASEERQAQLAYLEAALQTFNQALALEREEVRALVTWSQEATDASVGELSGRLDAQGRMLSRLLAGEGVLEVSEAVAALRNDIARLSRKLPAKPKNSPSDEAHTAQRAVRKAPTPPAARRRPTRPS